VGVTHEDGHLYSLKGSSTESCTGTAAKCIVHDLSALVCQSRNWLSNSRPYLRVSNENNLGAGAPLVVGVHSLDNGSSTLACGVVVADTTALRLSTAGRVVDSLRTCTGVGRFDHVYEASRSSIAGWSSRFASTEDIHLRAALTLLELDRAGGNEANQRKGGGSGDLHSECKDVILTLVGMLGFEGKSMLDGCVCTATTQNINSCQPRGVISLGRIAGASNRADIHFVGKGHCFVAHLIYCPFIRWQSI
jgi:hypothetical protein